MPRKLKYALKPINNNSKETIGNRIARLRKLKGLTQNELGEIINITQNVVSDYETGRAHLSDDMIIRFSYALGVSSDELLGFENKNTFSLNLRLVKRLKELDKLPESKQKTILRSLDLMIDSAKREMKIDEAS